VQIASRLPQLVDVLLERTAQEQSFVRKGTSQSFAVCKALHKDGDMLGHWSNPLHRTMMGPLHLWWRPSATSHGLYVCIALRLRSGNHDVLSTATSHPTILINR